MLRFAAKIGLLLTLGACTSTPNPLPARGTIGWYALSTTVDSPVAVRYLAAGDFIPASSDSETMPACSEGALLRENLTLLSQRTSVDTAAIFAARCLFSREAEINAAFLRAEANVRGAAPAERAAQIAELSGYTLVFVPGWNYQTARDASGADFRRQRELFSRHGAAVVLAPLEEHGSIEANALILRETLDVLGAVRKIILISASSGGAVVAHALGGPDAMAYPQVAGWLNIGGKCRAEPRTHEQNALPGACRGGELHRHSPFGRRGAAAADVSQPDAPLRAK
jgi:hypothetical protein